MLIIALVLALIGLVALVFAVVTSNELVAWVCIGASVLGVVLLIIDALRERQHRDAGADVHDEDHRETEARTARDTYDYPEEAPHEGEQRLETTETTVAESLGTAAEPSGESVLPAERWGDDHGK
jgi:heme exporter protein D